MHFEDSSTLYDDVMSLLALSSSMPLPELEHFENFDLSKLRQQLCDFSEQHLVSISCPRCLHQNLVRAQLWQQPTTDTRLYIIPELGYEYTSNSGVGFFLMKGQVIGRTRFYTSHCSCDQNVTVKIA